MSLPLICLAAMFVIFWAYVALDVLIMRRRRHHEHLLPNTPRKPRG